jgi:hypothetical protein
MGKGNAYKVLLGKGKERSTLGRPRCRWDGNIKMVKKNNDSGASGLIWFPTGTNGALL